MCAEIIDIKFRNDLAEMAKSLGLTFDKRRDSFAKITRKLFQDGINWGRIVALLSFGYEIAVSDVKEEDVDIKRFLQEIESLVVAFSREEDVVDWIKHKGGWISIPRDGSILCPDNGSSLG